MPPKGSKRKVTAMPETSIASEESAKSDENKQFNYELNSESEAESMADVATKKQKVDLDSTLESQDLQDPGTDEINDFLSCFQKNVSKKMDEKNKNIKRCFQEYVASSSKKIDKIPNRVFSKQKPLNQDYDKQLAVAVESCAEEIGNMNSDIVMKAIQTHMKSVKDTTRCLKKHVDVIGQLVSTFIEGSNDFATKEKQELKLVKSEFEAEALKLQNKVISNNKTNL